VSEAVDRVEVGVQILEKLDYRDPRGCDGAGKGVRCLN
jgi:hypothetical protein